MHLILIICITFFSTILESNERVLNCNEKNKNKVSFFNDKFSKIIDLKNKTLTDITGGYDLFDKVIMFGRNEVILKNKISNTHSTLNLINKTWTIYSDYHVKLYTCTFGKNRAPLW